MTLHQYPLPLSSLDRRLRLEISASLFHILMLNSDVVMS